MTEAEENIDLQTRKIRTILKDELNVAKTSGKCPQKLYAVVFAIGQKMFSDVQEMEGLNSLVKLIGNRAPNISLELLSSRISLKKRMGIGRRGSDLRYSSIAPQLQDIVMECVQAADKETLKEVGAITRWAPPDKLLALLPTPDEVKKVKETQITQSDQQKMVWAATYNAVIAKACSKSIDCKNCLIIGDIDQLVDGYNVYVAADKVRSTYDLAKWEVQKYKTRFQVSPVVPFEIASSIQVIAKTFERVHARPDEKIPVFLSEISWSWHGDVCTASLTMDSTGCPCAELVCNLMAVQKSRKKASR